MELTMTRMTQAEKEQFLAGLHVGVLSLPQTGRAPLTVPVWYDYTPGGELWFLTGPESRKGRLLTIGTPLSLCAQTETPPYRYVSVEGTVTSIAPSDREREARPMAHRYLGHEMGDRYTDRGGDEASVTVRVRPERWLAVDYSKLSL
jgi:nitroimidazol reductase NimA-like FMN-containing flavoprotein (pyridoxamine 5'-phosphate oxidase superfamily)